MIVPLIMTTGLLATSASSYGGFASGSGIGGGGGSSGGRVSMRVQDPDYQNEDIEVPSLIFDNQKCQDYCETQNEFSRGIIRGFCPMGEDKWPRGDKTHRYEKCMELAGAPSMVDGEKLDKEALASSVFESDRFNILTYCLTTDKPYVYRDRDDKKQVIKSLEVVLEEATEDCLKGKSTGKASSKPTGGYEACVQTAYEKCVRKNENVEDKSCSNIQKGAQNQDIFKTEIEQCVSGEKKAQDEEGEDAEDVEDQEETGYAECLQLANDAYKFGMTKRAEMCSSVYYIGYKNFPCNFGVTHCCCIISGTEWSKFGRKTGGSSSGAAQQFNMSTTMRVFLTALTLSVAITRLY